MNISTNFQHNFYNFVPQYHSYSGMTNALEKNPTYDCFIKDNSITSPIFTGSKKSSKATKAEKKEAKKNTVEVPDVTGMDSKDAIRNIELYGLKYQEIPEDHSNQSFVVVDQYPKAGTRVDKESVVYIYSE